MTRSRRVAIDTGFSQNGSQWSSFGSGVSFQSGSYTQFDLPFTVVAGNNAISTVTLWNNGIVSFGPPTAEQIAFVAGGLPPFAGLGVTNPADNPGFPGEFLSFAYDDNEIRFAHDWAQGVVDFQQPYVLADAQPAAFFAFGSDQLIFVEGGFTILSDSTTSHIGYHIGSQQEILTPSASPFTFLAIEHDGIESFFSFAGTIGHDMIDGTAFNDVIDGDTGNDTIEGGAGNDILNGAQGTDTIFSGEGDDLARGGDSGDTIYGGSGDDYIYGGTGSDVLNGGIDNDRITGGNDNDFITGGQGDDVLIGGAGDDDLNGGAGNDSLSGGSGNDIMRGRTGDDNYQIQDALDFAFEQLDEGFDTVRSGVDFTISDHIERLFLSGGARSATGNALANTLSGSGGSDTLSGLDGDDVIRGNIGRDIILGGNGEDLLDGGAGKDTMTGGADRDVFQFRTGDTANTRTFADIITDFDQGQNERIQLVGIDANDNLGGIQSFEWIATNAFSNTAGEMRFEQVGGDTFIEGDTNGDGVADLVIRLTGLYNLTANDIIGVSDLLPNREAVELPIATALDGLDSVAGLRGFVPEYLL
jgi:Ca2+-binding RTX toxin-like protein